MTETADGDGYGGVLGALPYAFRRSDSWLFRSYVVVGTALAAAITGLFALALIVRIDATVGGEGTLSLSRSFFALVGFALVLPILAPILFVARRHRRGKGNDGRYDRRLGFAGFWFLGSLYVGLVATVPPEHRTETGGVVVQTLYDLPPAAGVAIALFAALLIYYAHRVSR